MWPLFEEKKREEEMSLATLKKIDEWLIELGIRRMFLISYEEKEGDV